MDLTPAVVSLIWAVPTTVVVIYAKQLTRQYLDERSKEPAAELRQRISRLEQRVESLSIAKSMVRR